MEKLPAVAKLANNPDRPYSVIKAEMQVKGMSEGALLRLAKSDSPLGKAAKKELNHAYGFSNPRT